MMSGDRPRGFMAALQDVCWEARYPLAVIIGAMWIVIIVSVLN
jgi:hypothetical protein